MRYPPKEIDPTKDLFKEVARYAVEHYLYLKAIENGENDHGPWQEFPVGVATPRKLGEVQRRNIDALKRVGDIGETYFREGAF